MAGVFVPGEWEIVGRGFDVGTEGTADCHTDVACHFPMLTVATAIAFYDCTDFPFAQIEEEGVAGYSDFAYQQGILLTGGQTFFASSGC